MIQGRGSYYPTVKMQFPYPLFQEIPTPPLNIRPAPHLHNPLSSPSLFLQSTDNSLILATHPE